MGARTHLREYAQLADTLTGWMYVVGITLFLLRRPRMSGAVLLALGAGSLGILWDRFSTRSGAPRRIRSVLKPTRFPADDVSFAVSHIPAAIAGALLLWRGYR